MSEMTLGIILTFADFESVVKTSRVFFIAIAIAPTNKTRTCKVGAIPKAQKAQNFQNMPWKYL